MSTRAESAAAGLAEATSSQLNRLHLRRGMLIGLCAATIWSLTSGLVDILLTDYHLTPVQVSFWRALIVAACLGAYLAIRDRAALRLTWRELPFFALMGVGGVASMNLLWSVSVEVNKSAVAAVLIFSAPAYVALVAWLLFGETLTVVQVGAMTANLLGCALVAGIYDPAVLLRSPTGLLIGLASGVPFAFYTLMGKAVARRGRRGSLTTLFYSFAFASAGLLLLGALTSGPGIVTPPLDASGWALLGGLAVGPTLIGYSLYTLSLAYLPSATATLVSTLEPPLAAIFAFFVMGRSMNAQQWLGTALIVAGVAMMQGLPRRSLSGQSQGRAG